MDGEMHQDGDKYMRIAYVHDGVLLTFQDKELCSVSTS